MQQYGRIMNMVIDFTELCVKANKSLQWPQQSN